MEITFVLLVVISFVISVFVQKKWLWTYILAFKYDFLSFLILFLFYHFGYYLKSKQIESIFKFFWKLFKIILIWWIIWYSILLTMPGLLKLFGYSRNIFDGSLMDKPPAVYLTHEKHWIARNQFIFERPISYGFFLVMFFPLFYFMYLKKQKFSKTYILWGLYVINLFSTFSRAAIWAWFVEILILGFIQFKHNYKKLFIQIILPIFVLISVIWLIFKGDFFSRKFSDSWHLALIKESLILLKEKPIFWYWPASAWPASHWYCTSKPSSSICQKIKQINIRTQNTKLKWFNTENQYLQVLVEFGLVLGILWIWLFGFLGLFWLYLFLIKTAFEVKYINYISWLSIWVFGLMIEWLALHSFVDRMIVYPAMLMFWLALAYYFQKWKNK